MSTISRKNDHVIYNPAIHGYNTNVSFWKTLTGAPTLASNKLRMNASSAASILSYLQYKARFVVNAPVAPVSGQDKFWGFAPYPGSNNGRVGFLTAGAVLSAVAYDDGGNVILNQAIAYDPTWAAADTVWEITVNTTGIWFAVNGKKLAKADVAGYSTRGLPNPRVSTLPGFIYVYNGNADNMDTSSITIIGTNSALPMSSATTTSNVTPGTGPTDLGKAEDSPHATGDVGIEMLAVRRATPTSSSDTEGDYSTVNQDANGNQWETLGTRIAGEDIANDLLKTETAGNPTYISTATTTLVKTGAGTLYNVTVEGGTAGTIIGYDNTAASGTILFSFSSTNSLMTYQLNLKFAIGLTIVTSAATQLTASTR